MNHHARVTRPLSSFTITLMTTVSLLVSGIVGCEAEPISSIDGEVAAAESDEDGFRSLAATAEAISADPLFTALLDSIVMSTSQRLHAQAPLSDEDLDAFVRTVSHPSYLEVIDLEVFLDATGVDAVLLNQQMNLMQMLINEHDLGHLDSAALEAVFAAAVATDVSQSYLLAAIEYELHDVNGPIDSEIDQCEALCIAQEAAALAVAFSAYVSALALATLAGPGWPIAAAAATAAYFTAMAKAEAAKDNCFAICRGETPSNQECVHDSDCNPNEYCWTGVLGIGKNECRPEKSQGQTCSRHGQCASNCCKLHFWTNPISKTCRPSSSCN